MRPKTDCACTADRALTQTALEGAEPRQEPRQQKDTRATVPEDAQNAQESKPYSRDALVTGAILYCSSVAEADTGERKV